MLSETERQGLVDFLNGNKSGAITRAQAIIDSWSWSQDPLWIQRVEEAELLIQALQECSLN